MALMTGAVVTGPIATVVFGVIPKTSTGKIQKFLLRDQVDSAKAISA